MEDVTLKSGEVVSDQSMTAISDWYDFRPCVDLPGSTGPTPSAPVQLRTSCRSVRRKVR